MSWRKTGSLFVSSLLLVLLLAASALAVSRTAKVPELTLNWLALVLAVVSTGAVSVSLLRKVKQPITGSRPAKRRWYSFSATVFGFCALMPLAVWAAVRLPGPMGTGPASATLAADPFIETWSARPVVLLSLGDSVSTGFGAPEGRGYVAMLARNHDEAYPDMKGRELKRVLPALELRREAVNSSNSIDHLRTIRELKPYPEGTFGIVCITTGGIDLIHNYGRGTPKEGAMYGADATTARPWIDNFERRLDEMMNVLLGVFPGGCAVFIATIYDPTDGVGDIENAGIVGVLPAWADGLEIHTEFNNRIRAIAARHDHAFVVDLHAVMLGHGIHCRDNDNPFYDANDPTYWYYVNLEDPNERGYDAIRREFLRRIVEAMRAQPAFDVPS